MKKQRLTKKQTQMIQSLRNNLCNVSESCKAANVGRSTHYDWLDKSDTYKKEIKELENDLLDLAEGELLKLIKSGDRSSIFYYLNNKGRERGYMPKTELQHTLKTEKGIFKGFDFLPGDPAEEV